MVPAQSSGKAGPRSAQRVRVVHLPSAAFRALADGDLAAANMMSPVPLTEYFVSPEWRGTWRMRSEKVARDPASAAWVTGVIWDEQAQTAVGRAGYHGPPDHSGMVEIGYAVDPACRRRGHARAALEVPLFHDTKSLRDHDRAWAGELGVLPRLVAPVAGGASCGASPARWKAHR